MTVVERTYVWAYGRETAGVNYGGESIFTSKINGLEFVMLMLHEFSHDFGLSDKYSANDCALGNLMGCKQNIRNVKLTPTQQMELAQQILIHIELIKHYGRYDKWLGDSAKNRAR